MTMSLDRLIRPESIAVIGGGAWCANVIEQCLSIGFDGPIWPVHPKRSEMGGLPAYPSIDALPHAPDAAFIGVNRHLTVEAVAALSQQGAGGAVCFASGFAEAQAELADGADLQDQLLNAASDMPFLGPNCYGFVNAVGRAALWPDIHGMLPQERGIALVTQSSNLAINLTMQHRGLPIAYCVTAGNQAQTGFAQIGMALLDDPAVTALGLHIEGINDLPSFIQLAKKAHDLGKPIVALKVGASEQAQTATVSHTASLAGSHSGAQALLKRLGIAQVSSPAEMIEALKIVHVTGGLRSKHIASMSCSGGEASLMADLGQAQGVMYPALKDTQKVQLREALGPKVALANPLDYHTYIWGNLDEMTATFKAMMQNQDLALGCLVLDFPRTDRFTSPDWTVAMDAMETVTKSTDIPMSILASLPENLPETVTQDALDRGLIPLCGMPESLAAIAAIGDIAETQPRFDVMLLGDPIGEIVLDEAQAKAALSAYGLRMPKSVTDLNQDELVQAAHKVGYPLVLKGVGLAHKTESGAVAVNLQDDTALIQAAQSMPCDHFLIEEMITDTIAELLIGVIRDPAHGFVLTLGAGGVLTEVLKDAISLSLPVTRDDVKDALATLKIAPVLAGYRGASGVHIDAILDAVDAVQSYVAAHADTLLEIEINPLIARKQDAVAVDALIRKGHSA